MDKLKLDQEVTVRLERPRRAFKGTVSEIVSEIDSLSRTVLVKVHLHDTRQDVLPGTFGNGTGFARGLDVTPDMIRRLQAIGDTDTVAVLETILRDEIGHVEIGSRWYRYLCRQRGLDPVETFRRLLREHAPGRIRRPLNTEARQRAGFDHDELELLEQMAANN